MDRHRREFGMDVHREFRRERRWLILNRNFIDSRVEKAKERKEKVNDAVLEWLDEAGKLLDDISEEIEKSGDKYYSDMIVDIKEMNGNRKFKPFSTAIRSSGPIIIRRKKETSDQLLKALEDDELRFNSTTLKQLSKELQDGKRNVIGLHGKPGSGKTTLAKAVRDKAKSLKIFDEVLFVTVSQNPNIRKIQDQIAKSLNLRSGRATEIKSTLGRKNGILVILDDVPSKCDYDPVDIGIPSQRCKFLLTTSSEQDCSLIIGKRVTHCETIIPMGPLSEDDAWSLLQEYSGIDESDGSFNVAKEVASACDWLPGTIIDVSSSFIDKSSMEWTKLLHSVKHSTARYQIFLSYNVSDTRNTFTIPLYQELTKEGLKTFMDRKLRTGDQISAEVIKAIEDSRLSIIILSENYLDSAWCLDELVHVLECKETKKQLVWPIFYKVEPKDIKQGTKVKAKLQKKFKDPERIEKWKSALEEVSSIGGFFYKEGTNQTQFILEVIDDVMEAKKYLYIQNMDMECEEIERLNADREFQPDSSQSIVDSKSQSESQSSRSNPTPDEGTPDPLLIALKENRLSFNSETLKELSKELQNDSINQIALHGKRGSGKTRLVEAVRDKAKSAFSTLFEVVLFATVSQNNIRLIQDQIARGLDLKFENESEYRRAKKIEQKLDEMKRILVILDDVPAGFDPEKIIGIPCNDQRCKFLLTARAKKDFPSLNSKAELRRRKSISMLPLSKVDAWMLLQEYSGIEDEDESILSVAKEIANEYEWMPGAIVDIGSSLKGKRVKEWKGLLNSLRHSNARYQIFLSFRGIDTREHFTSTLCEELTKNGLKTFMDNELKDGDQISTELVKAIEDSRLSIVILSKNYPNSAWCLDELVHILECMKSKKQLVWPVFYKVEPTHIRHQNGVCAPAIAELEQRFDKDKIAKWKKALFDVCSLTGRTYEMPQPKFIQGIVQSAIQLKKTSLYIRDMEMV